MRICEQCRQPLPENAPEGLCPACLARVALDTEPTPEPAATLAIGPDAFVRVRYFGDYELLEEIAHGGMGVVWKARQTSLNRIIALKMILAGSFADEAQVQRFRREAEAAANLQHPNIVAIHEVGEHDGQHYYSMDFIQGRDLAAVVRESGPLPPARAAECLKTIAEAVHFAHQRGTLHRDLKPQNVLMDAAGVPHITDFGLAKFVERDESLTQSGAVMGSPSYMPPEQAAGHFDQVGTQSDVYALGAILYELLTGRPPFRADTAIATMRQVMESDPVAPRKINAAVPPDLETICLKCLEKNPARRYPSAQALAEDLGRFLNHEPIQALRAPALRKVESWLRRHPWTLMAAGSLVVMVLAGLLYWQYERLKFLQQPPSLTAKAPRPSGLGKEELDDWFRVTFWIYLVNFYALRVFQQFTQGKKKWMDIWNPSGDFGPRRPVSQRVRVISGLLGLAGLGCATIYFAKLIQASVWVGARSWDKWIMVYPGFYSSLALLSLVVRDYQAFIHGAPSQTLSGEQSELVRQAIFNGNIPGAVKLYRRAIPKISLEEAVEDVRRIEAELKAKQPEKFTPPPERSNLTWRESVRLRQCAMIVLIVFLILLNLRVVSGARLLSCAAGLFLGAGMLLSRRLKSFWTQRQAQGAFLVCFMMALVTTLHSSYIATIFFFGGIPLGVGMIWFGFTPKRRKSAPSQGPADSDTDSAKDR